MSPLPVQSWSKSETMTHLLQNAPTTTTTHIVIIYTMKTHYETLGVKKDASQDDIKQAFRKLSLETHPDVGGKTANAERFKQISQAANILSNNKKRAIYDRELMIKSTSSFERSAFRKQNHPHPRYGSRHSGTAEPPLQQFFQNIIRPRTFVLGTFAIFATAYASSNLFGNKKERLQEGSSLVKAWLNPKTGQWEQPAPWDPDYQNLRPTLKLVPREEVKRRHL